MVLVATASMSSSPLPPQAPSTTPQEPATLGEMFRIDQATGAASALERVKVKDLKVGRLANQGSYNPVRMWWISTLKA